MWTIPQELTSQSGVTVTIEGPVIEEASRQKGEADKIIFDDVFEEVSPQEPSSQPRDYFKRKWRFK